MQEQATLANLVHMDFDLRVSVSYCREGGHIRPEWTQAHNHNGGEAIREKLCIQNMWLLANFL